MAQASLAGVLFLAGKWTKQPLIKGVEQYPDDEQRERAARFGVLTYFQKTWRRPKKDKGARRAFVSG